MMCKTKGTVCSAIHTKYTNAMASACRSFSFKPGST